MRDKVVKLRVSDDELARLKERSDRPRLAEWLRDLGLGQRKRRAIPVADPALLRQLAAIGNNLNQIARWTHSREPVEAMAVSAALIAISRELEALRYAGQDSQQG